MKDRNDISSLPSSSTVPARFRMKLLRRILSAIGVVALVAGLFAYVTRAFHPKIDPESVKAFVSDAAPATKTVAIAVKEQEQTIEAVGTLHARFSAELSSRIAARVSKVHVRAGDEVKEGQVLIELDERDLQAQRRSAHAALNAAQAQLSLAKKEHSREARLFENQVVSQQSFDLAQSRLLIAEAEVARARQQGVAAASMLDYASIVAPDAGVVVERHVEPGDLATPGRLLLSIYDPEELRLEALVSESLLPHVSVGQSLAVRIDSIDKVVDGTVHEVVPRAASTTRTFLVRVQVPKIAGLYPGMFGRVRIPVDARRAVLVPDAAVRRIGQIELVRLVDAQGHIEKRYVRTGKKHGDQVEVISGIDLSSGVALPRVVLQ